MDKAVWIMAIFAILFALMGVALLRGHGSFFLVSRTFSSVEERNRFDALKYLRFLGWCVMGFDLTIFLSLLSYLTHQTWLAIVGGVWALILAVGTTVYNATGKRFEKDETRTS